MEVGTRRGALFVAAVLALTPTLAAQKKTDPSMPLPETSRRMRNLEPGRAVKARAYRSMKCGRWGRLRRCCCRGTCGD